MAGGLGGVFVPDDLSPPVTRMALQAALGFGLIAPLILVVGSWMGVTPVIGWLALIAAIALLRGRIRTWFQLWRTLPAALTGKSALVRLATLATATILVSTFMVALAPPIRFDALVYHLALPRAYLQAGRIFFPSGSWFWGMPQTGEMLYTWAMALVDERAAAVLGWAWGVVALAGIFGYVNSRFGRRPAWVAISALLSGYTLSYGLGVAYIDWPVVLFGLAALVTLEVWWSIRKEKYLLLAGLFCGSAIATKLSAGIILVCALCLLVYNIRRDRIHVRRLVMDAAMLLVGSGIMVLPWLLKNFIATGNPMYPFLFAVDDVSRFRMAFYRLPVWGSWLDALLLPFQASLMASEGTPGYSATIGPLLISLAPLAFLSWGHLRAKAAPGVQVARVIALAGVFSWVVFSRLAGLLVQTRLYFVIFPAFAVLAASGYKSIQRLKWPGVRLGRVTGELIILVYSLTAYQIVVQTAAQETPQVVLGLMAEQDYREQNLGWYARAMEAVKGLPGEAQVNLLWEPRSLDCLPFCDPDEVLDRWITARLVWKEPGAIKQQWIEAGYTHLLYYRLGADFVRSDDQRYSVNDWQALDDLLRQLVKVSDFGEGYSLYTLNP